MFLYYLPGNLLHTEHQAPELLQALRNAGLTVPLRCACRSVRDMQAQLIITSVHSRGPDGKSGTLVMPRGPSLVEHPQTNAVGYYPAEQDWTDCGSFWLGVDRRFPATAEDLAREPLIPGTGLMLGDGREWHVPIIRRVGGHNALPQKWGINSQGEFQQRTRPEYTWAWEIAGKIWDGFNGRLPLSREEAFHLAIEVLSLNYCVGPHEATALGLVDSTNYIEIFKTAIDGHLLEELLRQEQMKGEADAPAGDAPSGAETSNSSPGLAANSPTITPAAETCTS